MNDNKVNLQQYTRQTVKNYLRCMEDHQTENLYDFIIDEIEKGIILEVLEYTKGNQTQSSKILGITRTTLRNKVRKHSLATD